MPKLGPFEIDWSRRVQKHKRTQDPRFQKLVSRRFCTRAPRPRPARQARDPGQRVTASVGRSEVGSVSFIIIIVVPLGISEETASCPKTQANSRPASAGAFRIDASTLASPSEARTLGHEHADPVLCQNSALLKWNINQQISVCVCDRAKGRGLYNRLDPRVLSSDSS